MNTYIINVSLLKSYNDSFNAEISAFKNTSLANFNSSYLNNNSNYVISTMFKNLTELYTRVNNGYDCLSRWFSDYISNVESLESHIGKLGGHEGVTESSIRAIMYSKLQELPDYNIKYSSITNRK